KKWMLTRYRDIDALLRDPRFSSQRAPQLLAGLLSDDEASRKMLATWSQLLFSLDPPQHTRIRRVVNKGFTHASIEELRPMVAALVRDALAPVRDRGELDVAVDLADPVALNGITEMFAIPREDRPRFRQWTTDMLKPGGAGANSEEIIRRVKQSSQDMLAYL